MWEQIAFILLSAVVGGLIGGGVIGAIGYRALKDKLIHDLATIFARVSQITLLDNKVEQMRSVAIGANDLAADAADSIIRLQESDRHHTKTVSDALTQLNNRLDRFEQTQQRMQTKFLETIGRIQGEVTTTAQLLDRLEQRMNRHLDGGRET